MVTVTYNSEITLEGLTDEQKEIIKDSLSLINPKWDIATRMNKSLWGVPQKLKYYREDGDKLIVPIGKLDDLRAMFPLGSFNDARYTSGQPVETHFTGTLRDYQQDATNEMLKHTNGVLCAKTGCHSKGTRILLYSGEYKNVENITLDDVLMGPDSTPRKVLQLCSGNAPMYKIEPVNGEPFVVNGDHYLTLIHTTYRYIIDVQVKEVLGWLPGTRHLFKLFRVGVDFPDIPAPKIDPYFVGVLLGDGSLQGQISVTTGDFEVVAVLHEQAKKYGCTLREVIGHGCTTYYFTSEEKTKNKNSLINALREEGLFGQVCNIKTVPKSYKVSSANDRKQLLAGLLDTDGSYHRGYYDFISKSEALANDVVFLARSLGMRAKVISTKKYSQTGKGGTYWRVSICGNVASIPCKIARKKVTDLKPNKDQLVTGFSIKSLPENEYYGFVLDKDQRYLFEEFWVTHNSGKTAMMCYMIAQLKQPTLILVHTIELANQFRNNLVKFTNLKLEDIGMIGNGKKDVKNITVGLLQSVTMDPSLVVSRFGVVLVDETHIAPAETYAAALSRLDCRYKYGASATPERADGLTKVIFWITGPLRHQVPDSALTGVIIKPTTRVIETNYYFPLFDTSEYQDMVSDLAMNAERNDLIIKAMEDYPTQQIVLLCLRHTQVKELAARIPGSVTLISTMTPKQRKAVMADLLTGKHRVVVTTYALFSTGIDLPELEVAFFCAPMKSNVKVRQSAGRLMRISQKIKKKPIIVDFYDKRVELLRHQNYARQRILRSL